MALAKKTSNSSRMVVIGLVVIIVIGLGYFLGKEFFQKSDTINTGLTTNPDRAVISNFGDAILNDSRFTELHYTPISINADANLDGGQQNPFQ